MRRHFAALLLAAAGAALAACSHDRAEDPGPQGARTFAIGPFSEISVAGSYDVRIKTGGKPGVSATGPQNVLDQMVVEVDGNRLRIHPQKKSGLNFSSFGRHGPVTVEVSAPALSVAAIAGSGDIAIDRITGDSFNARIAGSGSLDLGTLAVKSLDVDIAGSGDVRGSGQAERAKYAIAGSGNVELGGLQVADLDVSVAGSGDVTAQATRTAKVSVMGSGDVRVTGGAKCETRKMGSGEIVCS